MSQYVHILNGDELNEDLLRKALGREGISDYAPDGLTVTADYAAGVYDVTSGKAFILDNGYDTIVEPPGVAGQPMATDGVNHIYLYFDLNQPDGERYGYHSSTDQTPPSQPSLRIAEVDMAAQTVTPVNREAPRSDQNAVLYKNQDIDADGDGVVDAADEAHLVQGANVSGAVGLAEDSQRLGGIAASEWLQDGDTLTDGFSATGGLANGGYLLDHELPTAGQTSRLWRTNASAQNQPDFALYRAPAADDFMRARNLNTGTDLFRFDDHGNLEFYGDSHIRLHQGLDTPLLYRNLGLVNAEGEGNKPMRILRIDAANEADIAIDRRAHLQEALAIRNAAQDTDLVTVSESGEITAAGSITANGDEAVVTEASASSLSVGEADGLTERGHARRLIKSPNVHHPLAALDPGESIQVGPIPTENRLTQVWVWGVQTGTGGTNVNLELELLAGNETQQNSTTAAREEGDPTGTAAATTDASKIIFRLTNATGSGVDAGFFAGYYLKPNN